EHARDQGYASEWQLQAAAAADGAVGIACAEQIRLARARLAPVLETLPARQRFAGEPAELRAWTLAAMLAKADRDGDGARAALNAARRHQPDDPADYACRLLDWIEEGLPR
ncbi:MAG: hypothetical protein KDE27_03480, partial [Planctomycetes bacterium]|nr:hypothetical protein [Planctomycetota bacterium]